MASDLKMEIVLDEDKIAADGRYTINQLYEIIEDEFKKHDLVRVDLDKDGITYAGVGTFYEESWKYCVILLWLEKKTDYVQFMKKWIWHISKTNQENVLEQIYNERKKEHINR